MSKIDILQPRGRLPAGSARKSAGTERFVGERLSTLLLRQDEQLLAEWRTPSTWRTRISGQQRAAGALA